MRQDIIKLFDIRSGCAVKALCFHHKKPWILAGLATGIIQVWNYHTNTLLNEFEAHNGPVQSIDVHVSCPLLFASAGCDGKIKLWDYETSDINESNTTVDLVGHEASVNDVRFHHKLPWLVSASDDHTVRLWNWKYRSCIAVLANHTAAVTSCSFHPIKDLVLSSSLDRTLCLWDIGGLRDDDHRRNFFSRFSKRRSGEARLTNVLEGHKSGVVRAGFHPTLPVIFSSSDDCSVYCWKKEKGRKSYHHEPVDLLQTKGISPLAYSFMYSKDDENVFLHDDASSLPQRKNVEFFEGLKNLSSLCWHPTKDFFATGHANGMSLHRVIKEPPGFLVTQYNMYYVKDGSLWSYDLSCKKGNNLVLVRPIMEDVPVPTVTTVSSNRLGETALICVDNTSYVMVFSNVNNGRDDEKFAYVMNKGRGMSAVLVVPYGFAVLTKLGTKKVLTVRTLSNKLVSETVLPCDIYTLSSYSGLEKYLICKAVDRVVMFDIRRSNIVSELRVSSVHFIFWGSVGKKRDRSVVIALVGDYFITVADAKLKRLCTVEERTSRIENGAWDDENDGVFVYKTWKEIKYCLVNGDSGTIMTYNEPIFITKVSGNTVYCLDEDGEVRVVTVDASEYVIKSSILNKDYMKQCCVGLA